MAVMAIFQAIFVDHRGVIVIGERPIVLCLAQNTKQAGVVFGYIAGIIEATPLLAELTTNRTSDTLSLSSGVDIEVRAASFRGLRGVTTVAVIGDEAAFWQNDDGGSVNPDSAILDAVRPSLATTGGPLIVISSPYARRGAVFETWQRHYGDKGDPLILVAHGASRDFNPSLPQKVVDDAMGRDPAWARAEYLGQFRSDIEQFIKAEAVEACVIRGAFERPPRAGLRYQGFIDPSGGADDSMTLAIAHREGERAILDAVREIKPPFSPKSVVAEFAVLLKSYKIERVGGDHYAGEWPREVFRNHGIEYVPAAKSRSDIYGALLPLINSGRVDLLDDKKLVSQLCGLERRTGRSGKDTIDHASGAHDDLINAAAGAKWPIRCSASASQLKKPTRSAASNTPSPRPRATRPPKHRRASRIQASRSCGARNQRRAPSRKPTEMSMSFRMLPPINVALQTQTVSGRKYSAVPGSFLDVPDFDAGQLAASGYIKICPSGTTAQRPTTNPNTAPPYFAAPGFRFYDTTISAEIYWDGATWRSIAGASL